ncbi:MAG: hypothetical protein RL491_1173 [Bacteroidota bacterium]
MDKAIGLSNKTGPAAWMLVALITAVDYLFHDDVIWSILYVAPVFLSIFHPNRRLTSYISIVCTGIIMCFAWFNNDSIHQLLNHALTIAGIWSAWFAIISFRSTDDKLSKERERLRALFEYATEGIVITDQHGEIVMINPTAEKKFGYESNELIGKKIEALIPDRFSKGHVRRRDHFNQSPHARPMGQGLKLFAKRKDGSEFPVEISLSNFSIDQNKFVIAFIIDVSEKALFLDQIRQEKELAQMYLDIAPVMFLAISMDERVTLINQEGCRIIGLPESSIIGKNWFDIFKPDDTREEERIRFQSLKNIPEDQEFTVDHESVILNSKGDRRLIAGKAVLIRDHTGKPITLLASGDDVTERRQQEKRIEQANIELKSNSEEILKLNSELEARVTKRTEELGDLVGKMELANAELATEVRERRQAEELLQKNREELRASLEKEKELGELKSRFVTMASHEFRTPLSTILSSASLVSKYNGSEQQEQRTKHLDRIKSSVNNLTAILNDFLSLGKLEEGKVHCNPSEFDVVSFANELTNEMRELTRRGQIIIHENDKSEAKVLLDKNLTRNICINLLSNAIKYSEEGKTIIFKTSIDDGKLHISVTDQGIGIPDSEQQHIFDRFFRANNAMNIQGTGLGLNIVKKYAELMGGEISFTSQPGKGTTFHVTLPQTID